VFEDEREMVLIKILKPFRPANRPKAAGAGEIKSYACILHHSRRPLQALFASLLRWRVERLDAPPTDEFWRDPESKKCRAGMGRCHSRVLPRVNAREATDLCCPSEVSSRCGWLKITSSTKLRRNGSCRRKSAAGHSEGTLGSGRPVVMRSSLPTFRRLVEVIL
jgi:hypothetical protein